MTRADLDKQPGDVAAMFDGIAERYDLLNDILSAGQVRLWRRAVARIVGSGPGDRHGHVRPVVHRHRRRLRGLRLLPGHAACGSVPAGGPDAARRGAPWPG